MLKRWACTTFLFIFILSITIGYAYTLEKNPIVGSTKMIKRMGDLRLNLISLSNGNPLVEKSFEELSSELFKAYDRSLINAKDIIELIDALKYTAEALHDTSDSEELPCIVHSMRVTTYLMSVGKIFRKEVLIAAILHETLDLPVPASEMKFVHLNGGEKPLLLDSKGGGGWSLGFIDKENPELFLV